MTCQAWHVTKAAGDASPQLCNARHWAVARAGNRAESR
jgi:hypothetical protein